MIEIIVTIIVTAIMATMVYAYLGRVTTSSITPIQNLESALGLNLVMSNIKAAYYSERRTTRPGWEAGVHYTLADVRYPNPNIYCNVTLAGISGADEPNWPDDPSSLGYVINDNTMKWDCFPLSDNLSVKYEILNSFRNYIAGSNPFGSYTIERNQFIRFSQAGNASPATIFTDDPVFLELTISNGDSQKLTAVLGP